MFVTSTDNVLGNLCSHHPTLVTSSTYLINGSFVLPVPFRNYKSEVHLPKSDSDRCDCENAQLGRCKICAHHYADDTPQD